MLQLIWCSLGDETPHNSDIDLLLCLSNTPPTVFDFQPTKTFLLSPTLLDIQFLRGFSKKLDSGSEDKIVISINHSDACTNGWVQEAIKTLPCVDVEGKHWEKHLVDERCYFTETHEGVEVEEWVKVCTSTGKVVSHGPLKIYIRFLLHLDKGK
ncbi:hypothetical protein BDR04DRAFT_121794 [Suillus decipiens]|nr:hypothetical protein BDR04DRAFT_121794 [Suillus decipiens]